MRKKLTYAEISKNYRERRKKMCPVCRKNKMMDSSKRCKECFYKTRGTTIGKLIRQGEKRDEEIKKNL